MTLLWLHNYVATDARHTLTTAQRTKSELTIDMPRPVRIAICQFASEPPSEGSVSANLTKLDTFVASAAAQRADVVVFPEYFLTGQYTCSPRRLGEAEGAQVSLRSICIWRQMRVIGSKICGH